MEADEPGIDFRPYSIDDIPLIRSSWANSFYKGNHSHKLIPPDDFHHMHRSIIDRFFMRPKATIIVCCEKKDPNNILGWVALEIFPTVTVIHYIYVKFSYKGEKISSKLLEKVPQGWPFVMTHMTERVSKIIGSNHEKFKDWNYIPQLS